MVKRALIALPALALVGLGAGFAWFVLAAAAPPREPIVPTAGIAVLTGGAERLETGLRLLRDGHAERLLVSGAHRDVTLEDLARLGGVPPAAVAGRVVLGRDATSTRGNALEIAAWTRAEGLRSVRVVTAGYHMQRALIELRREVGAVQLVPHPVVPPRLRTTHALLEWRTWSLLGGEYLKLLAAAMGLAAAVPNGAPRIAWNGG